jgi:integrase
LSISVPSDKATNPDGLAFMTAQGKELVRTVPTKKNPKKSKRHDAVKDSFEELCKVAGVRCRGFYLLRHTGLNMMLRIGKQEMADLYSQHAPETVSEKFYENSNWKKLRRCLRKMRIKLEPMFSGKAEVKVAAKPAEEKTAA